MVGGVADEQNRGRDIIRSQKRGLSSMWKIFFEYMDKSKITLTGKGSDISLRLAMKYNNLYNREAVRAEYQRYPKNKYAAIPLEAKIKQLKETEE